MGLLAKTAPASYSQFFSPDPKSWMQPCIICIQQNSLELYLYNVVLYIGVTTWNYKVLNWVHLTVQYKMSIHLTLTWDRRVSLEQWLPHVHPEPRATQWLGLWGGWSNPAVSWHSCLWAVGGETSQWPLSERVERRWECLRPPWPPDHHRLFVRHC